MTTELPTCLNINVDRRNKSSNTEVMSSIQTGKKLGLESKRFDVTKSFHHHKPVLRMQMVCLFIARIATRFQSIHRFSTSQPSAKQRTHRDAKTSISKQKQWHLQIFPGEPFWPSQAPTHPSTQTVKRPASSTPKASTRTKSSQLPASKST